MSVDMTVQEQFVVLSYMAPITLSELEAMSERVREAQTGHGTLYVVADLTHPSLDLSMALAGLGTLMADRNNPAEDIEVIALSNSPLLRQMISRDAALNLPIARSWQEAVAYIDGA